MGTYNIYCTNSCLLYQPDQYYCKDLLQSLGHIVIGCGGECVLELTVPEGKALIAGPDGAGQYILFREGLHP